ncbi:MAG: hypothetical protein LBH75_06910 [Treponema sp.]|jgi:hypothetical protein|nr:hypothetical protein [Treponema sp.]
MSIIRASCVGDYPFKWNHFDRLLYQPVALNVSFTTGWMFISPWMTEQASGYSASLRLVIQVKHLA